MDREALIKGQGMRLTAQRRQVAEQALTRHKHFSAEELYDELRKKRSGISRATVYRTLKLLADHNVLEMHDFDKGYRQYESQIGRHHHDHLICLKCGRITEFENEAIEVEQEKVARHYRFKLLSHSHKLYGVCPKCRNGK